MLKGSAVCVMFNRWSDKYTEDILNLAFESRMLTVSGRTEL